MDERLHCFTNKDFKWWRNLTDGKEIGFLLKGKRVTGKPVVLVDEPELMQIALADFLTAV